MDNWKPLRRHDVVVRRSGSRTTVHDTHARRSHRLNETAEFIWRCCDGEHTLREIEALTRSAFDVPAGADVDEDVTRTVSTFLSCRLLEPMEH